MKAALLRNRAVIALSGPDTRDFLQGLVTNDMAECTPGRALYAGLLTPQGKLLFDFLLVDGGDGRILVDCARERAGELAKRLGFYRLRAKVAIEQPALAVAAFWDGDAPAIANACVFADPRLAALGSRAIGPEADLTSAAAAQEAGEYEAHRIALGIPSSADIASDAVFALDAGFEELHGVSFRKGCYVGQEVTARMKHRATARRRFYIAETPAAIASGTAIEANGKEIGTLTDGNGDTALALVRLDRLAEAEQAGAAIVAAGTPIRLRRPPWLTP